MQGNCVVTLHKWLSMLHIRMSVDVDSVKAQYSKMHTVYVFVCCSMALCNNTHILSHTHTHAHMHTHAHTQICMHTFTYTYLCTYTNIHMCTHTHTHTHTHLLIAGQHCLLSWPLVWCQQRACWHRHLAGSHRPAGQAEERGTCRCPDKGC